MTFENSQACICSDFFEALFAESRHIMGSADSKVARRTHLARTSVFGCQCLPLATNHVSLGHKLRDYLLSLNG